VARRMAWYARDRELGRASVAPGDVVEHERGVLPQRWRLEPADGAAIDLVLRNRVTDVPLPDVVFTRQGLENQRFPKF
jgi:hypothetical protein